MFFAFVLLTIVVIACMLLTFMFLAFVLFLMMNNRAIWNVIVTKTRVFIGSANIQAIDIILVREVVGVTIIDRLNLKTEPQL